MKKFISMIVTVAMLLSLCVLNVSAATSAHPSINVYAERYDGTNPPANYKAGTYDVYKVWYTTSGVDTQEDIVTGIEIKFSISDESKVATKSWSKPVTSGPAGMKDANGIYSGDPLMFSKGYIAFADTDSMMGVNAYNWDLHPDGGTEETLPYVETLVYVTAGQTVTFTYSTTETILAIDTYSKDNDRSFSTDLQYTVNGVAGNVLTLGPSAPATVDVTSVTISGATAATVGDNVQLSATVLPDNATDKTVTWTKVSGNGAVSSSGVVTATAAGDVVVKATAGGVDSANYTVSFAAAVPADIVPAVADKDTYSSASTGLQDAFGNDVTIDSSRSYGAAKFENVVLDDGEYVYKVFATGTNKATGLEETKSWDVVDGSVELTGASVSFIAIVRSATHTITSVVLKAFAK